MIDKMMKTLLFKVIVAILLVCCAVLYLHFHAEHKQAQRELEYRMAHQRVAQEKQEREQSWERRMAQERLRREYNQGRVIGADGKPVQ